MKLTKEYLKGLVKESLEEGDFHKRHGHDLPSIGGLKGVERKALGYLKAIDKLKTLEPSLEGGLSIVRKDFSSAHSDAISSNLSDAKEKLNFGIQALEEMGVLDKIEQLVNGVRENKISKSTLDKIIKEEYTKLVNEGGDFDPSAKRSTTVYTARGTSVSLGLALDKGLAYRFEKGGKLIYPEKYQKKHWGYTISDKPSEPEKPDHPTVAMAKKFVASYDRADRLDNLPGDLFHTRPDRLEILGRARKAAAGDETVNLTQQELDNFYK